MNVADVLAPTLLWALAATGLASAFGLPLAYGLARGSFPGKSVLAALTSLPLVIPPTAVGYLLLQSFADQGWLGRETLGFDLQILLTWRGVILACAVMSFPLIVRTARVAFEEVDPQLEVMARTLGRSRVATLWLVTLPLAWKGLLAATILGFTRALGEFGATVMVAGNIPGQTQTLAAAIYSAQQAGNRGLANVLLLVALGAGFLAVFLTEWLTRAPSPTPGAPSR